MSSLNSYRCPFHLLEITLISAQELASVSKNMHTYAVTWIDPSRRLTTRVDRHGLANPSWNDKFIFRVDNAFLANPTSAVVVDIYAVSWLRDVRLGSVRILISNLLPPPPSPPPSIPIGRRMRFVALQIRRPSGRPQGILNIGVTILERAMRSMPLYTELSLSPATVEDSAPPNKNKNKNKRDVQPTTPDPPARVLRRTKSERSDKYPQAPGSVYEGSSEYSGSMYGGSVRFGSEIGAPAVWNGSMCSDVGPSPSVVAAAVARGLYRPPGGASVAGDDDDDGAGSMVLGEWTEESSVEGLRSKLERWRLEMPPIYDRAPSEDGSGNQQQQRRRRKHNRRGKEGGGGGKLFSCFANAYGCEFSVKCGTKSMKKNKPMLIGNGNGNSSGNGGGRRNKVHLSSSEVDSSSVSQSYV